MITLDPKWLNKPIKYQQPASGIKYNFDTFLDNLPTNSFDRGQTQSSIQWTPNWGGIQDKYNSVEDLEANDQYKAFTDYVINNYQTDPRVMDYLKLLENTTTGNGHQAILFNNGQLNNNWQNEYRRLRNDHKYGYYHLGPEGNPEIIESPIAEPGPVPESGPISEPAPVPQDFTKPATKEKSLWSDWLPHTANLGLGLLANARNYQLEQKKNLGLLEAPWLQGKVTNNYSQRTDNQQAINELQNQTQQLVNNTSNINDAVRLHQNALDQATKYNMQNNQLKANEFAQTTQNVNNIANQNNATGTEVRNKNQRIIDTNKFNLINAREQYNINKANLWSNYINNMYYDYQGFVRTQKLNDKYNQYAQNQYDYNIKTDKLTSDYQDFASDYTKSDSWNRFRNDAQNGTIQLSNYDLFSNSNIASDTLSPEQLAFLKNEWSGDVGASYRDSWKTEVTNKYNDLQLKLKRAKQEKELADMNQPYMIDNQIFNITDRTHVSPAYSKQYKKGGRVSRLIDYIHEYNREQQHLRTSYLTASRNKNYLVARDLDALDDQTLTLLKQIFK